MNVLSLFDGMSGAKLALDNLKVDCKYYDRCLDLAVIIDEGDHTHGDKAIWKHCDHCLEYHQDKASMRLEPRQSNFLIDDFFEAYSIEQKEERRKEEELCKRGYRSTT